MHKAKHTRTELAGLVLKLRDQFDRAVRLFEQQDFKASSDESMKLGEGMADLISLLVNDYGGALTTYKLPKLGQVKTTLAGFEEEKNIQSRLSDLTDTLLTLNKYIDVLERETKKNYPLQPRWISKLIRHKKPVLQGTIAALVLVGGVAAWRQYQAAKTGLRGYYFSEKSLSELHLQRNDRKIDFNWGMASPIARWKKDEFSIQWTGYLRVPADGVYEFFTHSDDGVRLWIGNQELISNWSTHAVAINKAAKELKRGYYPIRLEYFEQKRKAVIRLLWRQEGQSRSSVIAPHFLVPSKELLDPEIPLIQDDQPPLPAA